MRIEPGETPPFPLTRGTRACGTLSGYHSSQFVEHLRHHGYASISPADWGAPLVATSLADWVRFADSWDRLDRDCWMGDGGRYRRRRFAAFAVNGGTIARKPHQPHFQSCAHNRLNGGIARWFSPVETVIGDHGLTRGLLQIGEEFANALTGWTEHRWHAELHQFRIDATHGSGQPTPEGRHRDGVTAVLMVLIGRRNVRGGVTMLSEEHRFVAELSLKRPLQALVLDDRRLRHSVSAVTAREQGVPAWRDALVITFRPERMPHSFASKETCYG
ncbi:2OG-Fe dioxygenase family protein [Novosphingobium album (ex Liu et al. 2023)]|uniref:2OG-Fe dioxygenase family protein n=1 Tax=Novosphingobium album (ex Liu et al. 2023) TaxID=3031130 RepID=A0ABT5WKU1_9SPHN|nr:2OG-Fe dioxygenase family protein [Novosphingobium album (ex Liu et al. 2023)]MDE8650658.1 2OG-Fe dioxygenase family protein [Novosphingobium album (ex Liu et al. 2023)]